MADAMTRAKNEELIVIKELIIGTPGLKTELEIVTGETLPEFFCIKTDISGVMYQGQGKIEWLKIGSVDLLRAINTYEAKTGNKVPIYR